MSEVELLFGKVNKVLIGKLASGKMPTWKEFSVWWDIQAKKHSREHEKKAVHYIDSQARKLLFKWGGLSFGQDPYDLYIVGDINEGLFSRNRAVQLITQAINWEEYSWQTKDLPKIDNYIRVQIARGASEEDIEFMYEWRAICIARREVIKLEDWLKYQ